MITGNSFAYNLAKASISSALFSMAAAFYFPLGFVALLPIMKMIKAWSNSQAAILVSLSVELCARSTILGRQESR